MGSIATWGAIGSGGQVLPRVHSAQVGYLPGLSISPCSQGVSSTKNPNSNNMQNNRTQLHPSPKMDSSLHLVPGRCKAAPGGSLRKDSPGWEKAENKFTSGLPACVCVCPVSPPYMHV